MIDFIRDAWSGEWWEKLIVCLMILSISLIPLSIWAMVWEARQWSVFSAQHYCVVVGYMTGDTFVTSGVSANGQPTVIVGSTAGKTGYRCDDGMTYWR